MKTTRDRRNVAALDLLPVMPAKAGIQ